MFTLSYQQAKKKNKNFNSYEEMGGATVDPSWFKSEGGQRNYWNKTQKFFKVMRISLGFPLQGPVNEFDSWNVFNKGLYGVRFFECLNIKSHLCFWICKIISLNVVNVKCSKFLKNTLINWFFSSLLSSVIVKIQAPSNKM